MTIAAFTAQANFDNVLERACHIRDWLSYWLSKKTDGSTNVVRVVIEITDFTAKTFAPTVDSKALDATFWPTHKQVPASYLKGDTKPFQFANSNLDFGKPNLRDIDLMGFVGSLALEFLADEPAYRDRVVRLTFQHVFNGVTWNHNFDASWNQTSGVFQIQKHAGVKV
jgi:hypothetical protein